MKRIIIERYLPFLSLIIFMLTYCFSPCFSMENFQSKNKIIRIKNNERKSFDVIPVNSVEDSNAIPKELGMDYRLNIEDTKRSCSYLKGIDLDVERIRSQVWAIKDGSSVIGVATLIVTPFKHLSRKGFLQFDGTKIIFKSIKEILDVDDPDIFVIETAWFCILPKYRNKKLGKAFVSQVLISTIENLVKTVYKKKKVLIISQAGGCLNGETLRKIHDSWKKYLEGEVDVKIPMPENFYNMLGKVDSNAKFTSIMAQKFNFECLKVYGFSLGPTFMKKLF